eukprot:scaffold52547_cov57-Attheya_sp.AAC.3
MHSLTGALTGIVVIRITLESTKKKGNKKRGKGIGVLESTKGVAECLGIVRAFGVPDVLVGDPCMGLNSRFVMCCVSGSCAAPGGSGTGVVFGFQCQRGRAVGC